MAKEGPVFNPWIERDEENELGEEGPQIRTKQLMHFLASREGKAKYCLIGEALGYQGGHFTGIPMTSERILLGYHRKKGILPEHILPGLLPQRTSKPCIKAHGFSEPTATIVWEMISQTRRPMEFVLWNAFAWHPFIAEKGKLSNRKPRAQEMKTAMEALSGFLRLFPGTLIIALGKVASQCLRSCTENFSSVRHPAQSGARQFRLELQTYLSRSSFFYPGTMSCRKER